MGPSRFPGLEWAGHTPSSPAPLVWEGPSCLPLLISRPPSYAPRTSVARGEGEGLEGRGLAWDLSRLPVPKWAGQLPSLLSCSSGWLFLPASPDHPDLHPMPSSTHTAWRGPWRAGDRPGSSAGSLGPNGRGNRLRSSPTLPGEFLPPASPDLPSLRHANPVWPPLLLPPQSPYILLVHFGVPPASLGIRVPHQRPAGTLVVARL